MLQLELFPSTYNIEDDTNTTTFQDNMKLPLHRWYRYTAGFSGAWVGSVLEKGKKEGIHVYEFLKEPLIRYLGEDFYSEMEAAAAVITGSPAGIPSSK